MNKNLTQLSKFISLILRHRPGAVGVQMNEQGWVSVEELIERINANGNPIDRDLLEQIVLTNDKQRFTFNEDKSMIRANQGHSLDIDLKLPESIPPAILYHGTAEKFLQGILENGIQKRNRHHVHLSKDVDTAKAVGGRHGKPVILSIDAKTMHEDGFRFYLSKNNVWLADEIPKAYISLIT